MTHRPWLNELFVKYLHFILLIKKMASMCDTAKPIIIIYFIFYNIIKYITKNCKIIYILEE